MDLTTEEEKRVREYIALGRFFGWGPAQWAVRVVEREREIARLNRCLNLRIERKEKKE